MDPEIMWAQEIIQKAPQLGHLLWLSFSLRHNGTMLTQGLVTFDSGRNPLHLVALFSLMQGYKTRRHVIKFF